MRLIHAVRELNAEREDDPIRVIALYTEPERSAMFVRHADEAYSLGPTATVDEDGKRTGAYLNYEGIKRALIETKADAVWPGWGFVVRAPRVRGHDRGDGPRVRRPVRPTSCASWATRSSPS